MLAVNQIGLDTPPNKIKHFPLISLKSNSMIQTCTNDIQLIENQKQTELQRKISTLNKELSFKLDQDEQNSPNRLDEFNDQQPEQNISSQVKNTQEVDQLDQSITVANLNIETEGQDNEIEQQVDITKYSGSLGSKMNSDILVSNIDQIMEFNSKVDQTTTQNQAIASKISGDSSPSQEEQQRKNASLNEYLQFQQEFYNNQNDSDANLNNFEQNYLKLQFISLATEDQFTTDVNSKIGSTDLSINTASFDSNKSRGQVRLTSTVRIKQTRLNGVMLNSIKIPKDKQGFLCKFSPSWFARWQERYFVLERRKLKYFKLNKGQQYNERMIPQGVINFDQFLCQVEQDSDSSGLYFFICVKGTDGCIGRKFRFKAETKEMSQEWQDELTRHIDTSEGFKHQKKMVGQFKPWKFDQTSEKQFLQEADTGDILLFRSSNAPSMLTRTLTGSQFDHVAMVLKFENDSNEIYTVEATGNLGVALNKWSILKQYVGVNKFYERVVFRHVKFSRSDRMIDNLEVFLREAVGQKYGLDSKKLMRKQTVTMEKNEERELIDEDRTFFCSELLAKAFKSLGILKDNEVSCSQFYPHHFSSRGDSFLQLTNGTLIGSEMQIIIDSNIQNIQNSID